MEINYQIFSDYKMLIPELIQGRIKCRQERNKCEKLYTQDSFINTCEMEEKLCTLGVIINGTGKLLFPSKEE